MSSSTCWTRQVACNKRRRGPNLLKKEERQLLKEDETPATDWLKDEEMPADWEKRSCGLLLTRTSNWIWR